MKSTIIFYMLLIFTFSIPNVFTYSSHKARLYNLLRKPLGRKIAPLVLQTRNDKDPLILVASQQTSSIEKENHIQTRENWDSGEDYYFHWANKNRRPVEYLTGRKREANKAVIPPRASRINGGLWRSGLVG